MLVCRITHKNYSGKLYASGIRGRWNSAGNKVIYCSESIPLAFLENMVRRQGVGFNSDFKIMLIEIPGNLEISSIAIADLEESWRDFKDYSFCQLLGDKWYNESRTPVLKVPSAVLVDCSNYVLNCNHTDYKKVKLIETTDLVPDKRIDEICEKSGRK